MGILLLAAVTAATVFDPGDSTFIVSQAVPKFANVTFEVLEMEKMDNKFYVSALLVL